MPDEAKLDPVCERACDEAAAVMVEHIRKVFSRPLWNVREATVVDREVKDQEALPSWPVFTIDRPPGRVNVCGWSNLRGERDAMFEASRKLIRFALTMARDRVIPQGYALEQFAQTLPEEYGLYGFQHEITIRRETAEDTR